MNTVVQTSLVVDASLALFPQLQHATGLDEEQLLDALTKGAIWSKRRPHSKVRRVEASTFDAIDACHVYVNYNLEVLKQIPLSPRLVSDQVKVQGLHDKRAMLVHRLDKAASGLMLIAHTREALTRLTQLFRDRRIYKHYRVAVRGEYPHQPPVRLQGTIENKPVSSEVIDCAYDQAADHSVLELKTDTGRKHQIRRQLADLGFPIIGDRLYGNAPSAAVDLQLEACRLAFTCPFTNRDLDFEC